MNFSLKRVPQLTFFALLILFTLFLVIYYVPFVPSEDTFGYNSNDESYNGPQGSFGSLGDKDYSSYYKTDNLLLITQITGIIIISIFISSILSLLIRNKKIQLELSEVKNQNIIKHIFYVHLASIIFILLGLIVYFGLANRLVTFSRIEGSLLIFGLVYSGYNIFYYGFLVNYYYYEDHKQILLRSQKHYEISRFIFLFINFIVFLACLIYIFWFCVKSYYPLDKFDLVEKSTAISKNTIFQSIVNYGPYILILYFVSNMVFLFVNKTMTLTQKLLQTKFVRTTPITLTSKSSSHAEDFNEKLAVTASTKNVDFYNTAYLILSAIGLIMLIIVLFKMCTSS